MDSPYKHNKPTAPPPPAAIGFKITTETHTNPPDYEAAMAKSTTVVHALVESATGGSTANTTITKTVSDHSSSDGWQKVSKSDDNDSDSDEVPQEKKFKRPNTIVNQEQDDKWVKITMKIPGLKVKYITHSAKNGRVLTQEYNRNKVSCTFVVNEDRADRKQVYKYESREPLKMNIQEEGSHFKFAENTVKWRIKKA